MPHHQSSSYRTLASFSRITLLHHLMQRGTMTVGDLAEAAELHHNTTREHLQRLIRDGFVTWEVEHREAKGRPRILYSAASGADSRDGCIREAQAQASELRGDQVRQMLPIEAVLHSPLQRQIDALDDHLDQTGFDAKLAADGRHVHLHECPYSEMARVHPEVCRVHFGLLRGILEQTDGPLSADALHPFVERNTCTLEISRTDYEPLPPERDPAVAVGADGASSA
ncbi:metalloregulator ArsR/SmtB family transcription factor [Cryobacterium sp. TMT3-29-2]|uniref:helix-turn-helix transcriptional regulator n=1 Tax=Cryobacterium sp. TMT3-29-2 TaxID=2555867 RepID=UPI0010736691|nr:helix-turn-helix domain-containing protein [Cryobacterium sp. TMT3-29-2]TFC88709.1 ArsR family transcriptional regulator [Cryobacterium sp. TMT3-29-2]